MNRFLSLLLLSSLAITAPVIAEVRIPAVLSDNMVLQRQQQIPIWGWDNPGQTVTVSFAGSSRNTVTGEDGAWRVDLPPQKAGGPYELLISGSRELTLQNLLVGDVWFCSGQSNMEWRVSQSDNAEQEIASADHPHIRHIKIPHRPAAVPQQNVDTDGWEVCTPETVSEFTAAGYFFARHLQRELDIPIGLIGCNWGGTRIEPWMPPVGFQSIPGLRPIAEKLDQFPSRGADGSIDHQSPLALFNGMVHPTLPYAIRGAIWYQGEANRADGMQYYEKMKGLIAGWRQLWQQADLPFYFVQLAPYRYEESAELEYLPRLWEAQRATLAVPHTGMAVTVDIGNVEDIHPTNKQEVGRRLALWALAKTYGRQDIQYSGPLYRSMQQQGKSVRLTFDHIGKGLTSRDGQPLSWFTIAGKDQNFVKAVAKIDGTTVVVSSPQVAQPVAVRFAWHQEAEPNLSNQDGLPAAPFRTDSW